MELGLAGKRALVTGSSRGIGAAIARELASEGVRVVVHGRTKESATACAREIGDLAIPVGAELDSIEGAARLFAEAEAALGGIDILVNNAGNYGPSRWMEIGAEDWQRMFQTNVFAAAELVRRAAPGMTGRGWGRFIHIGSTSAPLGMQFGPEYGASKAALIHMSSSLAKEVAPHGVTSNVVNVGSIITPARKALVRDELVAAGRDPDDLDAIYRALIARPGGNGLAAPIDRIGTPDEIAYAVVMLCSPRAGFINGAFLRVDGGKVPSPGL